MKKLFAIAFAMFAFSSAVAHAEDTAQAARADIAIGSALGNLLGTVARHVSDLGDSVVSGAKQGFNKTASADPEASAPQASNASDIQSMANSSANVSALVTTVSAVTNPVGAAFGMLHRLVTQANAKQPNQDPAMASNEVAVTQAEGQTQP
ncbi:hypothetical protein F6X40_09280 [Paraburkholderia sp. UCT31]|uniref:hypothetical protein n=1 Tax=Paraburkholderia sp. UCT31 TaxID=2615209 RepID=UPI001655A858|nr:hypothetical protein [Paraburkholderia sp. UCT31]MBC8736999.1 hypothetical protein [Paraburkholderia sp. UCT31]